MTRKLGTILQNSLSLSLMIKANVYLYCDFSLNVIYKYFIYNLYTHLITVKFRIPVFIPILLKRNNQLEKNRRWDNF